MTITFDQFEIERLAKHKLLADGMTPAAVARLAARVKCNHKTKSISLVMEEPKPIEVRNSSGVVVARAIIG